MIRTIRDELQALVDVGIGLDLVLADTEPGSLPGAKWAELKLEVYALRKRLEQLAGRVAQQAEPRAPVAVG